jgi:hypothetical protein
MLRKTHPRLTPGLSAFRLGGFKPGISRSARAYSSAFLSCRAAKRTAASIAIHDFARNAARSLDERVCPRSGNTESVGGLLRGCKRAIDFDCVCHRIQYKPGLRQATAYQLTGKTFSHVNLVLAGPE